MVLKQPLHQPLEVEKQVIILFALGHGYLDNVSLDKVKDFENSLFTSLESKEEGKKILDSIRETKELGNTEEIKAFLDKFA